MYCTCGEKWCDARNQCSAARDGGVRGHGKVGVEGMECGPDCALCHPSPLSQIVSGYQGPVDPWNVLSRSAPLAMTYSSRGVTWPGIPANIAWVDIPEDPS